MRTIILFVGLLIITSVGNTQELRCNIQVNAQSISGSDRTLYNTLQTALYELMNNKKWTNHLFTYEERIECSFQLTITERSTDVFKGQLLVQSTRPVFNASYTSPLFQYLDKELRFEYIEDQTMEFIENQHVNNLTSILAYYAYIIIGMDFETFKEGSGTTYFDKAQNIVNTAQSDNRATGWKAFESQRNRYWIVENLTNGRYNAVKSSMYQYHRLGLDIMYEKQEDGRQNVVKALEELIKVKRSNPNLFILELYMHAKVDELVLMFTNASNSQKARVVAILNEIDPANIAKYNKIQSG
jgi:hypothetical protein